MDNKWMPIATEMAELVKEKNEAYGDAVGCSDKYLRLLYPNGVKPEQYRDMLMLVRDFDKNMRIAHRKDAFGESPWRDKIGYALLVVEMDERIGKQPKDAPERTCSNCGYYYKNVKQDIEVQCCSGNGTGVACEQWKPTVERSCETCYGGFIYNNGWLCRLGTMSAVCRKEGFSKWHPKEDE